MPAAIAPEETRTTCCPFATRPATASTIASRRCGSRRPREVSDDEPTFTTVRRADATAARLMLLLPARLLGSLTRRLPSSLLAALVDSSVQPSDARLRTRSTGVVLYRLHETGVK